MEGISIVAWNNESGCFGVLLLEAMLLFYCAMKFRAAKTYLLPN